MSRHTVQRRVQSLEQRPSPGQAGGQSRLNLACFSDEELEALLPLAEKREAAGEHVLWTAAELALLDRQGTAYQDRCPTAA